MHFAALICNTCRNMQRGQNIDSSNMSCLLQKYAKICYVYMQHMPKYAIICNYQIYRLYMQKGHILHLNTKNALCAKRCILYSP